MNCQSYLSWKIPLEIPENKSNIGKLFNIKTGKSFLKEVGGITSQGFEPEVLDPTNVFHNALNRAKSENDFKGRRFPYINSRNQRLNVSIRRFNKRVIIVTATLQTPINGIAAEVFELQKITAHPQIFCMIKNICGLILSNNAASFSPINSPKVYPCTQTIITDPDEEFPDNLAVEIITRHKEPTQNIIDKVISKNKEHQLDASHILVDRQGIFYRVPKRLEYSSSVAKKLLGTSNALEYAIALSIILGENLSQSLNTKEKRFIKTIIQEPHLVYLKSVTSLEVWKLLISEFKLDSLLPNIYKTNNNFLKAVFNPIAKLKSSSKTWALIAAVIGIIMAAYFSEKKFFTPSTPKVEIVYPQDQEEISLTSNLVPLKWEPVKQAQKYIITIKILKNNEWVPPQKGHRFVRDVNSLELKVSPSTSYQFVIQAENENDEVIAKSGDNYFDITTIQHSATNKIKPKVEKK